VQRTPTRVLVTIGRPAEAPRSRHAMSSDRLCLRGLGLDLDAASPFSPLPQPWSAATPSPTPGSWCRSPQPGAMGGPSPSPCFTFLLFLWSLEKERRRSCGYRLSKKNRKSDVHTCLEKKATTHVLPQIEFSAHTILLAIRMTNFTSDKNAPRRH
jgi:hypothetical protein